MLNRRQAQEMLETFRVENWIDRRLADIAGLPGGVHKLGRALLGRDSHGRPIDDRRAAQEAWYQAIEQIDSWSPKDRAKLFRALFPEISIYVEQAWLLQMRLPYQFGWMRKAFRAPNTPITTLPRRGNWLNRLLNIVEGYEQDITWFATWAPYLRWGAADVLGILFAAAIDAGGQQGEAVFDILCASARGEHEIGTMGRHVTRGLLVASRPDGWTFVEQLLLAAQQQEGLRQTILETIDEANPQAFRRILRLIVEHNLARFSATVRAVNVWFGFEWDSANLHTVNQVIEQTLRFLEGPHARTEAVQGGDSPTAYLALWTLAFEEAVAAVESVAELLADPDVERRFIGTHLLAQLGLVQSRKALLPALEDVDLRVVARALRPLYGYVDEALQETDLFERLEQVIPRFPRKQKFLEPIVWPWLALPAEQKAVAGALIHSLGSRSPKRLIPYLPTMSVNHRGMVVRLLAEMKQGDAEVRDTLFSLVGDLSPWVRERAIQALGDCKVTRQEASRLERLLTRKPGDLRRGVLSLLLNQEDQAALASADQLLESSNALQRLAGLELLRHMLGAGRQPRKCRTRAEQYTSKQLRITDQEQSLLDFILDKRPEIPALDDALGLLVPEERTKSTPPQVKGRLFFAAKRSPLVTRAATACLDSLDDLIHRHRTTQITIETREGNKAELLGNARFPSPSPHCSLEEDLVRLPLGSVWETWWVRRPKELRDDDGLELLRALGPFSAQGYYTPDNEASWLQKARWHLFGDVELRKLGYPGTIRSVLEWIVRLHPPAGAVAFLLDAVELTFTLVPEAQLARVPGGYFSPDWRHNSRLLGWLILARYYRSLCSLEWSDDHHARLWRFLRWMDEPGTAVPRHRPHLQEILAAFQAGAATEADLLDQLLGPRPKTRYGGWDFNDLRNLTGRKPHPLLAEHPILRDLVSRCRERIIEVELSRGDMPTAASGPALALRFVGGLDTLVRLLRALGREKIVRGWTYDSLSKASIFSHLVRATFPCESETVEAFAAQVKAARIPRKRLIELAVYAPQWASHVEGALQWPGLADAVWWIHAHTKDANWRVDQEIRETWNAQVSERTPLSGQNLLDGAVDVAWFHTTYRTLQQDRWEEVYAAAKYAAGGDGHKRVQLFADAMLGRIEKAELMARITEKRHQDSVRALGLIPLAGGEERDCDLLERYKVIHEFVRTSRKFGSQRRASEKLAAEIAMENLARTAGYPDPVRLGWAMEAQDVADLVDGPVTVIVGEVAVSLAINGWGEPDLTVIKGEKPLKSVPANVKKAPQIVELQARKRDIKRQASRMRSLLEQAMCRGDRFTGAELRELLAHPVLAPMLTQLVFVGDGMVGYPLEREGALHSHDGSVFSVRDNTPLRIAHPHDLLATKEWHLWQRECFLMERIQPFKQVFRELYVLTQAEKVEGTISRRYAGHEVHPRQALALLGQRGWVHHPEEGVRRTFHDQDISAWVVFLDGFFTPAEVEGLTIEGIRFTRRGEWRPLDLEAIPPRLFSEVMRDLDLVVSVAHRGGVDPEASASTIEMRVSLIRETCAMLKINNVRLQGSRALVEGQLGSYSIHLGSAVVHR
jgi:hypothetical protein